MAHNSLASHYLHDMQAYDNDDVDEKYEKSLLIHMKEEEHLNNKNKRRGYHGSIIGHKIV